MPQSWPLHGNPWVEARNCWFCTSWTTSTSEARSTSETPRDDRAALRGEIQSALDAGGFSETKWDLRTTEHDGDPVTALVDLVHDAGVDLLIVGTRRMSPIGKFLLERPLQRLLLEVEAPILVVKEPLPAE